MNFLNKIRQWAFKDAEKMGNVDEWAELFGLRDKKAEALGDIAKKETPNYELPKPAPGMAYGQLTKERPKNYFGNHFIPEDDQRFNGIVMPTRENLAYLEDNILPSTRAAEIPDQLVASQWAIEGGRNTEPEGYNWWGAGGTNPIAYDSMEQSVENYIDTIKDNAGLESVRGLSADEILELIQYIYEQSLEEGEYKSRLMATPEWRFYTPQ